MAKGRMIYVGLTAVLLTLNSNECPGLEVSSGEVDSIATLRSHPPVRIEPGDLVSLPLRTREDFVRYLYARAETALRLAGFESLHLEVRSLHTFDAAEFDRVLLPDLATGESGLHLWIEPIVRQVTLPEAADAAHESVTRYKTFELRWVAGSDWRIDEPWGRKQLAEIRGLTVQGALERAAQEQEDFPRIVAATAFEVHARFDGQARVYRAAFLWKEGSNVAFDTSSSDEVNFLWIDNVVLQIEQTITHLPIAPRSLEEAFRKAEEPAVLRTRPEAATGDLCDPSTNTQNAPRSALASSEEHLTEGHGAAAQASFTCSCDYTCRSTCSSSWNQNPICADTGDLQCCRTHKQSSSQVGTTHSRSNATDQGASCEIGHGCVFRSCLIGNTFCNVNVSATKSGAGVSITSSNATWEFNRTFSNTCPACEIFRSTPGCLTTGLAGQAGLCNDPMDPNEPEPTCQTHPELCTPIVVDLQRNGFSFTGRSNPLDFDIDGDGVLDRITWIEPSGDDAFLALDRNGNGAIDDGTELFGAVTYQPGSEGRNGFRALAVFDDPAHGGNGDGFLSTDDAIFPDLVLWQDINFDGVSQADEITSLSDSGLGRLSLDTVESRRRDRHGNQLRWVGWTESSRFTWRGVADVVFLHVDANPPTDRRRSQGF